MRQTSSEQAYPPIADYGLLSDMHSCALVSKAGSIDWCCFPRFDSPAVFARLLDWSNGGYFQIAPVGVKSVHRRYLPETNVLETTFQTAEGEGRLTDFMPVHPHSKPEQPREVGTRQQIIRIFQCTSGTVNVVAECHPRFDYGTIAPHTDLSGPHSGFAHGGCDALAVYCSAPLQEVEGGFRAEARLGAGDKLAAAVSYQSVFLHEAQDLDIAELEDRLDDTVRFWRRWSSVCTYDGEFRDEVLRCALSIKGMTYAPSGALLAAATTSLPEVIGGERNWDYRYTWIRDATFALYALSILGYHEEAEAFKDWLEWSTVGRAHDLQLMYGIGGERRLTEIEIPELEGYRGSRPVRIGNAAYSQFQLDIYGEVMDSAHLYRKFGGDMDPKYWQYLLRVVDFVIERWQDPDEGIWETRGGRRNFVFSKAMCWVALDRAIKAARALQLPGDVERWRAIRAEIKADVLEKGVDAKRGVFVQYYDSKGLDAANLMLPLVGFIRTDDPVMRATIEATERELTSPEGFVYRYRDLDDGMAGDEGTFTLCTFWLADNWIALREMEKARGLFDKLRARANDLGLYSEEIDARTGELLGNFPQAFSHLAFINTAVQLRKAELRSAATAGERQTVR